MNIKSCNWIAIALLSITLGACAGTQPGPLDGAEWRGVTSLQEIDTDPELIRDEPADLREAIERSYLLEAAGEPILAVDMLADVELQGGQLEEGLRALRLYTLAPNVIDFAERAAEWMDRGAEPSQMLHWLFWRELRGLNAWRTQRWAMVPSVPDLSDDGAPSSWYLYGPTREWHAMEAATMEDELSDPWLVEPPYDASRLTLSRVVNGWPLMSLSIELASVWWLESALTLESDTRIFFAARSDASLAFYVNETLVFENHPDEQSDLSTLNSWVELPAGVHRLRVRFAAHTASPALWFRGFAERQGAIASWDIPDAGLAPPELGQVRVLDSVDLSPGPKPSADLHGLRRWVWSEWYTAHGSQADRLDVALMQNADRDPVAALIQARLLIGQTLLSADDTRARALTLLQESDAPWAAATRLMSASIRLESGRPRAAMDLLEPLTLQLPLSSEVHGLQGQAWSELGSPELAERAYMRAWQLAPTHCWIISKIVRLRFSRGDIIGDDDIPSEWLSCDIAHELRLAAELRSRGRWGEAEALARILHAREPTNLDRTNAWRDIVWATPYPDFEPLRQALDDWRQDPTLSIQIDLNQALLAGDEEAVEAALDGLQSWLPVEPAISYTRALLGLGDSASELLVSVEEQRQRWLDAGSPGETPIVLLLDAEHIEWMSGAQQSTLRQQLIYIHNREGLDMVGELGVPADSSSLLRLAVHKPDGRVRAPDDDPNRQAVSMPDLEIGDIVEIAWRTPGRPLRYGDLAQRAETYFLGSDHYAIFEAALSFSWPDELDSLLVWDIRGVQNTSYQRSPSGDHIRTFTVRRDQPELTESFSVDPIERLPAVRVGLAVDAAYWAMMEMNRVNNLSRLDHLLVEEAQRWAPGGRGQADRLRQLFRAVVDGVDIDYGQDIPGAQSWRTKSGDRLLVLYTLLKAAGWSPEIVFISSVNARPTSDELFDTEAWDELVIRVREGRQVWWLDPYDDEAPFNYLRQELTDRPAWVLAEDGSYTYDRTPAGSIETELRRITLDAHWQEEGGWVGVMVDEIPYRLSTGWRLWLNTSSDELALRQSMERELLETFPGVEVTAIEVEGLEDPDAPLVVTAQFKVDSPPPSEGAHTLHILPRPLGRAYASQQTRTTPLVNLAMVEDAEVNLYLPEGWGWAEVEAERDIAGYGGQEIRLLARGRAVSWRRSIHLPAGKILPEDYPEFAAAMRALEGLSRVEFRALAP